LYLPQYAASIDSKSVPDGTIASVISMLSGVQRGEPLIGTEQRPRSAKNDERDGSLPPQPDRRGEVGVIGALHHSDLSIVIARARFQQLVPSS
jgi:hypothetical protein